MFAGALFIQDAYQLVKALLERFRQQRLFLVGHSWGSVLGLRFIKRFPELVQVYVGCGQVVNMRKSCRAAYDFALSQADRKAAERLREIDCSYTGENWLDGLLFVTRLVVRYKGSLYGRSGYGDLTKPFLRSKEYSISDLIRRQKGSLQSIRFLWQELMRTDFEAWTNFEVPVVFVEGRHDKHASSELAWSYYKSIQSEKQFFWFENSCHFPQWSESGRFHEVLVGLLGSQRSILTE